MYDAESEYSLAVPGDAGAGTAASTAQLFGLSDTLEIRTSLWARDNQCRLDQEFLSAAHDRACLIVGGGPSVLELYGLTASPIDIIATNVAICSQSLAHHRARMVGGVVLDEELLRRNFRRIVRAADFPIFTGNTLNDTADGIATLTSAGVYRILSNYTEGFGDTFGTFANGGHSGFAAIQLAYLYGYRRIALIGFDGCDGDDSHFHREYVHRADVDALNGWVDNIDRWSTVLSLLGVSIANSSPVSRLRRVPYIPVQELGPWARQSNRCTPLTIKDIIELREDILWAFGSSCETLGIPEVTPQNRHNMCCGGAVNAVMPSRPRPVPRGAMPLVVLARGDEWKRTERAVDSCAVRPEFAVGLALIERIADEYQQKGTRAVVGAMTDAPDGAVTNSDVATQHRAWTDWIDSAVWDLIVLCGCEAYSPYSIGLTLALCSLKFRDYLVFSISYELWNGCGGATSTTSSPVSVQCAQIYSIIDVVAAGAQQLVVICEHR